jgi:hypothetical protein
MGAPYLARIMMRQAEVERCARRTLRVRFGVAAVCAAALGANAPAQGPAVGDATGSALDRALQQSVAKVRETEPYEDHSTWENAWSVESDHYTVRTTDSYWMGQDLAAGLEVMRGHFLQVLGLESVPGERVPIWVFPELGAYNTLGGTKYAQHSSFYGSFFADQEPGRPVATLIPVPDNPTLLRMQITHSAVHRFLADAFPGHTPPVWIDEGLASYFALLYWEPDWCRSKFAEYRDAGRLTSLATLLNDGIQAYGDSTQAGVRFIELAVLFDYLLRIRDDTRTTAPTEAEQRAPFRDYLVATLRGQNTSKLPAHLVLQDREALDKDFRSNAIPR